ncbi:MAG: RCC1 repeat-containing protein, partial [Chloroflexi bacterium]|nr:RCC1 repeat-containing protein [Chloroflexota bacterium]
MAARSAHTCAITAAGGVTCWGSNADGQLGDGTSLDRISPVNVTGLTSSMTSLTAGSSHTCGLTEAGAVKCWGKNFDGQIGDGGTTGRRSPVNVVGLTSGAISVGAGSNHTCAVTATGGVRCWGNNSDGQLGDGTTTDRRAPVDVVGLAEGVISVAVGTNYSCAVTVTGSIQCWGVN